MKPHENRSRHNGTVPSHVPHFRVLLLVVISLACTGCGEDWQAQTYPASGRITINGEPPAGAVVELRSTGELPDVRNSRPWGIVDEDGSYTLSTYELADGAPAGDYKVVVRWPPDVTQPSLADRLGGAYSSSEKSQWSVTITENENELPPIEIDGAEVLPADRATAPSQAPPGPGMEK